MARQTRPGSRDLWTRLMFTETGEKLCFHQTDQGRIFLAISKRPENKGFPLLPSTQPAHQNHSAVECSLPERVIGDEPETAPTSKMFDKVCTHLGLNRQQCCYSYLEVSNKKCKLGSRRNFTRGHWIPPKSPEA